jgi:UDP-N-acetylglucosamine transferase subunit ALG13
LIFVTVGNSHYGFPRLIGKMDALAPDLPMKVSIQLGCTAFRPLHAEWSAFLTFEEMMKRMAEARLIIGHTSAGPILHARRFKVPLIAVPRRPELNEHVDGHQVETGKAVEGIAGIKVVWDLEDLRGAILSVLDGTADLAGKRSHAKGAPELISAIRGFVESHAAAQGRR